tara:strand:- start:28150 stop:28605 length:456 start_codon:yes stop_codon:yes gene_type:complete
MAYSTTPETKVTISVSESGMSSSPTSINSTQTLYAIDNRTKITKSTGVRVHKALNGGVVVFTEASMGDGSNAQAWLYVKVLDKNTSDTNYCLVTVASSPLGRIYKGQAAFIPLLCEGGSNITFTTDAAATEVEWCVWYEKADDAFITSAAL